MACLSDALRTGRLTLDCFSWVKTNMESKTVPRPWTALAWLRESLCLFRWAAERAKERRLPPWNEWHCRTQKSRYCSVMRFVLIVSRSAKGWAECWRLTIYLTVTINSNSQLSSGESTLRFFTTTDNEHYLMTNACCILHCQNFPKGYAITYPNLYNQKQHHIQYIITRKKNQQMSVFMTRV